MGYGQRANQTFHILSLQPLFPVHSADTTVVCVQVQMSLRWHDFRLGQLEARGRWGKMRKASRALERKAILGEEVPRRFLGGPWGANTDLLLCRATSCGLTWQVRPLVNSHGFDLLVQKGSLGKLQRFGSSLSRDQLNWFQCCPQCRLWDAALYVNSQNSAGQRISSCFQRVENTFMLKRESIL